LDVAKNRADKLPRRRIVDKDAPPAEPGEIEEAYQEVRALIPLHEDPQKKDSLEAHPTLPGVTKRSGDRIHAIVALRIQGFRDLDISKALGIAQTEPYRLERAHPEAFAKAEMHALQAVERKYQINLWNVRAALSEAGPRMVKVLIDLAECAEVKENVRKDSAIAVLNLAGAGYSRQSYGGKDSTLQAGAVKFIQNIVSNADKGVLVEEVLDAEIADE
jgi:hypothetical protein